MTRLVWIAVLGLAGCSNIPFFEGRGAPDPAPAPAPVVGAAVETAAVAGADAGASADGAVQAAAAGDTVVEDALGQVTVALGDPSESGLWLKTSLVDAETQGVATADNGESVPVLLRPLDGAGGAQISLQALQALGLPLTGLSPVTVSRG